VPADLSFVQHAVHRRLLADLLAEAGADPDVIGILVHGSVARGDAYPGSDLDLLLLLGDGREGGFSARQQGDTLVEVRRLDAGRARQRLETHPLEPYCHLDGRILDDPSGALAALRTEAEARWNAYAPPPGAVRAAAHWLRSARVKIEAAQEEGDLLRAGYVAATTAWTILESAWLANRRPMPPNGAVWAHLGDLVDRPPANLLETLFAGDAAARPRAALRLIAWTLPRLARVRD